MKNIRHESITNILCVPIALAITTKYKTEASKRAAEQRAHAFFGSHVKIARQDENGYECSLYRICEHAKLAHREFHVFLL